MAIYLEYSDKSSFHKGEPLLAAHSNLTYTKIVYVSQLVFWNICRNKNWDLRFYLTKIWLQGNGCYTVWCKSFMRCVCVQNKLQKAVNG